MTPATVAVIVPVYNRAHCIAAAIDSILAQDSPADEIVVVDDGSTDGTREVLAGYGPPVRVILQENGGAAAARNAGIAAARSDWLTFLDSDDLWRPGRLSLLRADLAEAGGDVVAHVANLAFEGVGGGRDLFSVARIPVPAGEVRRVERPLGLFLHTFFLIGAAFRRETVVAEGGFDLSYPVDEDGELAHRLAARGPFLVRGDVVAASIRQAGDEGALSRLRRRDPMMASDLKLRQFRAILARTADAGERRLAGAALADALMQRAALLRRTGRPGAMGTLLDAARSHPEAWKGWAKALRTLLLGYPKAHGAVDRT